MLVPKTFKDCQNHVPTAVTVGNFDGCHLGHQNLARQAIALGQRHAAIPVAVTFTPRPEAFFRGEKAERLLFTEAQKTRALGELGLKGQIIQAFDESFARTTHGEFYEEYLRRQLGAVALVVGDDFRFGSQRLGNIDFLREQADADHLALIIGKAVMHDGERISSTRIRSVLSEQGDVASAAAMLGRPFMLEGEIRRGDQLGRELGVPTANLEGVSQLVPAFGIYAGYVWLGPKNGQDGEPPILALPKDAYPAVFSIGIRPTLNQANPPVRIEAHLLKGKFGADDLYGLRAGYYLTHRLRGEAKFANLEDLKAQMQRDIEQALALLKH